MATKRYEQRSRLHFDIFYAPVATYTSLGALLAVKAIHNRGIIHLDFKNVFFNVTFLGDLLIKVSYGMTCEKSYVICLSLKKALYLLKEAARALHLTFKNVLLSAGFVKSKVDSSFFMLSIDRSMIYLLSYVDDELMAGPNVCRFTTVLLTT